MKRISAGIIFSILCFSLIGGRADARSDKPAFLDSATYAGLRWRNIGPALMSGRIGDIAVHPGDRNTWYVAVGSGGVWKTVNAGITWTPVFDNQAVYSIGCVTIDPVRPDVIWVGTGENVSGRHVGWGDGVYKSLNGGVTWSHTGLKDSQHIGRILVDPRDPDVVYAAAEGPLWSSGGERGVFRTGNGGASWEQILSVGPDTGVTDIAMEPGHPDVLYAAAYQRRRSVAAFLAGGPESGIFKSEDTGKTWRKLTVGLPGGDKGRIGLAVSPQNPAVVYATIEAAPAEKGFYRSTDRGESWEKRSDYTSGGTGPHYYQEIFADPHVFDRVYQMDVWMHVTEDGGLNFHPVGEKTKHSDNHALAFDPDDPDYLLAGCDGGLYETRDRGRSWRYFGNLPVTQFYKLALDNAEPFYNIHGGTQDNCSQMGPSRTLNQNGIFDSDWFTTTGADGYACAIDPEDPNIVYAEWQGGSLNRYHRDSGELVDIQPGPDPGDDPPRFNWDAPILISPHSHTRLYFASQFVWRSEDRGDSWTRISPDLTRAAFRLEQPIMGRTRSVDDLWDHGAMSLYGTITAIAESPQVEGLIYAGTDDGRIQVTEDGGGSWRAVERIPGAPSGFFVNDLMADRHDPDTVFAALDNHKTGDFAPYLFVSRDRGRNWQSLAGDLPEQTIVWALEQDPVRPGLLFIGTEYGIRFSPDGGKHWVKLKGGMPVIAVRDIEIQEREGDLVGASFGRGIFVLDDYTPLRGISADTLDRKAALFPVRKALSYIQRRPVNLRDKAFLGDAIHLAPNPPFGAVFTYYLGEPLRTRREIRGNREDRRIKAGEKIEFPGWDALREEDREIRPAIVLTVRDAAGRVVRRLTGPVSKGIHRVAWDLRYPDLSPVRLQDREMAPWSDPPAGPLAAPGDFTVEMARLADGELTALGEPQAFRVESLGLNTLEAKDRKALLAFQSEVGELQRAVMAAGEAAGDALRRLRFIRKALLDTPRADPALLKKAHAIERTIRDFQIEMFGDRTRSRRSEPASPSLIRRLSAQLGNTAPITDTHRKGYRIAAGLFEALLPRMRQVIDGELPELEQALEAAGAPWTPGRRMPLWKKKQP